MNDDELPLDDALALYEEAVALGLRASDMLEENIEAQRALDEADAAPEGEGDAAGEDGPEPEDAQGQRPPVAP